ncbi:ABC1 kinase family protein [Arenicella xantha]|uniref:Putative unusual protein kinase regulating ubiquinone biosynthesis (AarF/ABC1/UbiB family) n=1 Tax=Arenicella xantha TaxID=644221 RepID=A0A395JNY6_9GAMM|nr:AarF/ABC1/UbiB kinase family protein [Arenicella xantha]RBP53354.1 putative unusual protein kinase regulating ubiquinone biosynthesis (AarF/ABC1/UbiB family) [Arenicella xantha]
MDNEKSKEKAIPRSRFGRFSRVARMAGGVAAGMLGEGARQLGQGNRPKMSDLLLTPANAKRVAKQLSTMRGAAMKVGQLLSMETSDFLPQELSDILAQLRDKAFTMPKKQLLAALQNAYGDNWQAKFTEFDYQPLAAASIGQVHRATTLDGDSIVLKVQYPGVAESIDSDVDNIATLLRVTKLLPKHMDISQLLADAKTQLHEEADYLREAEHLSAFYTLLQDDHDYCVPKLYPELSTKQILAMEYVDGTPIETLGDIDPADVDRLASKLFALTFRELFELRTMQTDANFANYQYQRLPKKIVLLDFGATRSFSKKFTIDYKRLLRAVVSHDEDAILKAADRLGYQASSAPIEYQRFLIALFSVALEPLAHQGLYDFATARLSERLSELTDEVYGFKEFWQTPPTDILYLHRKLGGVFMLATRLKARVNAHALLEPYLQRLD